MFDVYADENFMTSEDGIFVAGDANRGASIVVWAIWEVEKWHAVSINI